METRDVRVYLDWNATSPPLEEALDAMRAAAREAWGNPASVHAHGRAARARVEEARAAVAELSLSDPRDVVLTSGATEANNIAIRSAFPAKGRSAREHGAASPVLVTSRLEHPSVVEVAEALERAGLARVRWVDVSEDGQVVTEDLARALAEERDARLVALQAVNHETGVIQPVAEVSSLCRAYGVPLHVDAVQAWGRVPFEPRIAETLSLAAHKIRGPKGIGALIARPGVLLSPVLVGGAQERGLRPGTVDPVAASGLAVAARHARTGPSRYARIAPLRDELERALLALSSGVRVNGVAPRAPHVVNLSWPGFGGPEFVAALDLEGVSVSSGSACSAGTSEPSPVVRAMLGDERAACALRISLGESTTREEVTRAVQAFASVVARAAPPTGSPSRFLLPLRRAEGT
jgi:cysteine desulfurase